MLTRDTGQQQWATTSGQPRDHKGEKPISYSVFIVFDDFAQV